MPHLTRRAFTNLSLGTLLTTSLLQMLFERDAMGANIKPITEKWLRDVSDLCLDLEKTPAAKAKVTQLQWQAKIEELFGRVELEEVLKLIDFEKLTADGRFAVRGERGIRVDFPNIEGLPTRLGFGRQVFSAKKDRSIVPHGHNNMATAFLVLKGQFHGKHYDRIEDSATHMIIKPTIDQVFGPTGCSTVSDFKDNVHWFKAVSDSAFLFNIHVTEADTGSNKETGRVYIDPSGEKLSGGFIRARLISHDESLKMYG